MMLSKGRVYDIRIMLEKQGSDAQSAISLPKGMLERMYNMAVQAARWRHVSSVQQE